MAIMFAIVEPTEYTRDESGLLIKEMNFSEISAVFLQKLFIYYNGEF
jgi:hypothetical protein